MKKRLPVVLIIGVMFLASCISGSGPGATDGQLVSPGDTPAPVQTEDLEKYKIGENAYINSIEILLLESFPIQIQVKILGYLPDGCTTVYQVKSERQDNTFTLKVLTIREKSAICTDALVPFEISEPLDVEGLPEGVYQVKVGDAEAQFTFTQDNIQVESSGSG